MTTITIQDDVVLDQVKFKSFDELFMYCALKWLLSDGEDVSVWYDPILSAVEEVKNSQQVFDTIDDLFNDLDA